MKNSFLKHTFIKTKFITLLLLGIMFSSISCKQNTREPDRTMQQPDRDSRSIEREVKPRAFIGEIRAVGNSANNLSGEIGMRIEGDLMRFTVSVENLAPDMMHMQYLLVSQTGDETQCPGTVDEVEMIGLSNGTTATSGTTIRRIPLHMTPYTLQMDSDTYPRTNINGELQFSHVISLDSLRGAVRNRFQMQDLDFSKFTFLIRGIPDQQSSAQTLSVGCAKLQETVIGN